MSDLGTGPTSLLIDPMFDLEPHQPTFPMRNGWFDRRLRLAFEFGPDHAYSDPGIWFFNMSRIQDGEKVGLASFQMVHSAPGSEPIEHACYEIKRRHIFSLIDAGRSVILSNVDSFASKHHDAIRQVFGDDWRADVRKGVVEELGGRRAFEDICLKAVRACHAASGLDPFRLDDWARRVDFVVVD